ncbi:hypothetical protein NPIL_256231 [Nephila pilipes]|uniref:Uncharacterized protein n=1 Tax=Nephila pilipes TaxID=299642 RepID=A0A8X6UKI0_NEPPI|nr:hypothetical protein NPIL_256231 [Nephila pilipes]
MDKNRIGTIRLGHNGCPDAYEVYQCPSVEMVWNQTGEGREPYCALSDKTNGCKKDAMKYMMHTLLRWKSKQ